MKLKNRLSLYSVLIFSVVIFLLCLVIYTAYYRQIEKRELSALNSKTLLAAVFYLEKDETTLQEHESIRVQLERSISRKNVLIIDAANKKFGGQMNFNNDISKDFLSKVRSLKHSDLSANQYFYDGIFYQDNQGDFVVISRVSKDDFNAQMTALLRILLIVFALALVFIFFFSRYLGLIAYKPINSVIEQLKSRSEKNFNEPVYLKKSYSEIQDLATEYNYFVNELNRTFQIQKNFIDYISHELRTPIAAIYGTLEVAKIKERSASYYETMLPKINKYTEDLEQTLDQMMLLSGAQKEIEFSKIRLDEVLFDSSELVQTVTKATINIKVEVEDFKILIINGDAKLLQLAFKNLIENAVKYSDNAPVDIILKEANQKMIVQIIDQGIGIPEADLSKITRNFYRAENASAFEGKGIGLSLARIIFNLHHAKVEIISRKGETCISVLF